MYIWILSTIVHNIIVSGQFSLREFSETFSMNYTCSM